MFHKANQMLVGYFTTVIWKKMTILKIAFIFPPLERPTKTKDQGILEIEIKDFLSRNFGQGIQGNQGILFI